MEFFQIKRFFYTALFLIFLAGCTTTEPPVAEYPVSPSMATTWVGGEASITWKGETNQVYTVFYTDAKHGDRAEWEPLPQATDLRGTGEQMTVYDTPPARIERRYLLLDGEQRPH